MSPPSPTPTRIAKLASALGILLLAAIASGHPPPRGAPPDFLRLQGYRGAAPGGVESRPMNLNVHGREQVFAVTELRRFSVGATEAPAEPPLDNQYFLQASPEVLSRFNKARPAQRITILATWHPGRRDLFVLALDLCPE